MNKDFRISIGSDCDHEDLTAEIYFKKSFFAMITQEKGFGELEIEIHTQPNGKPWLLQLDDFMEALDKAKQGLWKLRKIDLSDNE